MTDESKQPSAKPRPVLLASIALGLTALFSVLTAVGASSQRDWVTHETKKSNSSAIASAISSASSSAAKKSADVSSAAASASSSAASKYPTAGTKLDHSIDNAIRSAYISSLFTLLILGLLAWGTFRGRHWSRWGVTGIYVLALFTPLGVGPLNLVSAIVGNGEPLAIRGPVLIAGLAMLAAVVMVNLRPSVEYFALSRPAPRAGQPQRRGLFSRPPAPASGNQPRRTASRVSMSKDVPAAKKPTDNSADNAAAKAAADRARTKKRTNAESVARGAELARNRAKASKSRRTDR